MGSFAFLRRFIRALSVGIFALALPAALPLSAAMARGAPDSFADLAGQLLPTVVNIATTETLKPNAEMAQLPDLPPDSELQQLFKGLVDQGKVPRRVTSLGSGFVIDPSGLIVTNDHVIDQAEHITCLLYTSDAADE